MKLLTVVAVLALAGCASSQPEYPGKTYTHVPRAEKCKPTSEKKIAALFDRWNDSLQTGDPHKVVLTPPSPTSPDSAACPHRSRAPAPCDRPAAAARHVQDRRQQAIVFRQADHVQSLAEVMRESTSANTYSWPPRARTSCMFDFSFSSSASFGAMVTTGISSVTSASGPCFSSPAG
jgi:hypothetical protein